MNRIRRFAYAFGLALALVVGQQAAALHALGHATERFAQTQDSLPNAPSCDEHFLFAGFSGALAASVPDLPTSAGDTVPAVFDERAAPQPLRLAFRSRAPPVFL